MSQGPLVVAGTLVGFNPNFAYVGSAFYVNESTGSDSNGGNVANPFKTLATALAAVKGPQDTIYVIGTVHVSATVVISKVCRIVGVNPSSTNNRARISQTGATVFSPLVDVTAQGCGFYNLGTFHGFDDPSAQICWKDEGGRNHYENCDFFGMGHLTAAAQAGSRSLLITGSTGENYFKNCRLGLDTVTRATGNNATLEVAGGSPRNQLDDCVFQSLCTDAADVHILVGADGIDRSLILNNPKFINAVDSGGTLLTADISANAAAGGSILVNGGMSVGSGKIAATGGPVYVSGAVPTAATSSIGVKAS